MKKKFKKFVCRLFGHNTFEEVYAVKVMHKEPKPLFVVVSVTKCYRCGEILSQKVSKPMRRSELLKNGWFLQY